MLFAMVRYGEFAHHGKVPRTCLDSSPIVGMKSALDECEPNLRPE